jgi:hypothetical protein
MKTQTYCKFFFLVLLAGLFLTACGSSAAKIEGDELTSVAAYSVPAADHIVTGMVNMDYESFSADFTDQMISSIDAAKFEALVNDLNSKLGAYQSHELSKAEEVEGGFVSVTYTTKFEKATITMRLVHESAEPHLVSGLWFK